jgi:ElaB/YqjD/DUF883 family membrane-anchored ribosome-binding protein
VADQETQQPGAPERAGQVAEAAREELHSVAGDVRQEASAVATEAKAQARNVLDETRTALRSQARQGADRTAGALDDLSSQFRALASGDREGAGQLGRYADQASDQLHVAAQRIGSRGFDGLVDDMQSFARRRPGVFLGIAAASGFVVGRLFRGAQAASPAGERNGDQTSAIGELYAPAVPGGSGIMPAGPTGGMTPDPDPYGGTTSPAAPGADPPLSETGIGR